MDRDSNFSVTHFFRHVGTHGDDRGAGVRAQLAARHQGCGARPGRERGPTAAAPRRRPTAVPPAPRHAQATAAHSRPHDRHTAGSSHGANAAPTWRCSDSAAWAVAAPRCHTYTAAAIQKRSSRHSAPTRASTRDDEHSTEAWNAP